VAEQRPLVRMVKRIYKSGMRGGWERGA